MTDLDQKIDAIYENLNNEVVALEKLYWESMTELQSTSYSSRFEQSEDIEKLSRLGLALVSAKQTRSKLFNVNI